ncbi:hypothetical protein Dfri01_66800 [Dyadobacter frigoris]|uniref:helix-turn-helix domain-containing protein n=1 Tax=Dyadobacter frigoris TaxID=2576211 RepID=UPI00249FC2AE|nr:helix-turn-helix transcriptional regulator [Dyadobacter frigoris]GLU57219.1 hypothetical protein Dfri01_66800 [Dyadobacter frigoris]
MEGFTKRKLQLKCALALKCILEENKAKWQENKNSGKKDFLLISNLSQLSSSTGLRPATISNIFNGDTSPSITNVHQILLALNKNFTQFGYYFDQISDSELEAFEQEISKKKDSEKIKKEIIKTKKLNK